MADCPGVLHLAEMADGGLARVRAPGGRLSAAQARAIARLASRLGSGVMDLTNRANLQIRGLPLSAGAELGRALADLSLFVDGPADRRRNVLLDPLSGCDPAERADLTNLAQALDQGLVAAPWIGGLSPKFAFALDGGGRAGVAAVASDVALLALGADTLAVAIAGRPLDLALSAGSAVAAALSIAEAAAAIGPDARARDLDAAALSAALVGRGLATPAPAPDWPRALDPVFGVVASANGRAACVVPVAVGRLAPAALSLVADLSERYGRGELALAPWSAVVVPGVAEEDAPKVFAAAEAAGLPPVAVAERLAVVACAGAPACVRAREPAKALALALVAAATARPDALPPRRRSLHISACPKGCAGAAASDLLLLGAADRPGFGLHADAAPRRPGPERGRLERAEPEALLALLRDGIR
ncbi:precorrin-3B synthase [Methylopila turkensis]|uniref:Nitrite/Sulfite reductase ferredoxin-like domain-containing protein n=1 Tax=Methylopila turkensis TaxID=1437816 RepID=A0A9W6JNR6_9HYPH|nr:precorrin-3B synthase [Methylopila turkensis]GLK80552.1 hypothetical protein GCM10008174_22930 [Methylopila turkensis]